MSDKIDEIKSLSQSQYSLLRRKMKGFVVNREEVLVIDPDPKFFEKQASIYGAKGDVAFFKLLQQVRPGGVFAVYIEMQTDVTGCTKYGNGLLTRLYGALLSFRKTHPNKYVADIRNEINDIIDKFSVGGCSCGNLSGVLQEFRVFIKNYPKDPNTKKIRRNLTQIKSNSDFRANCQSG